jgi:hypothetical protein
MDINALRAKNLEENKKLIARRASMSIETINH